jgi:predicted TIM-barrel fold metal-dependent hydrolase
MRKLATIFASLVMLSLVIGTIGCAGETATTPTPSPSPSPIESPNIWIDAHAHLNPYLCSDSLCGIDLLVKSMNAAGVKRIVLFAKPGVSDSADVLEAYQKYPDFVIPCRGSDGLDLNDPTTLNLIRKDLDTGLFKAIGEIVTRHGFYGINIPADHPVMIELFKLGHEYGIPVIIHMGTRPLDEDQTDIPAEWLAEFERALEQCPSTTFIWAHSGPSRPDVLKGMLDKYPNLYADISALNPVFWEMQGREVPSELLINRTEWIDLLGEYSDRFLFGTDVHFIEGYGDISSLLSYVRDDVFPMLPSDAVEAIAHGNGERLFGISNPIK